jgi:diguanylate cyclase (GGDEF)-like protein
MTQEPSGHLDNTPQDGVRLATRTARRVVLGAFAATTLLVAALVAERISYQRTSAGAVADVKAVATVAGSILLEDERLTMSANLAAASGELRWAQRYDEHVPLIEKAIADALALASPEAGQRFDAATRAANDRLVEMERVALEHVSRGDLLAAQAVLNGEAYARQKAVLASGSDAFIEELQQSVQQRLSEVAQRSWWLLGGMLGITALLLLALWRHLARRLHGAEQAFSGKQEEVTRLALHDPLTGLANRRYLHMQLDGAIARAQRDKSGFSLLMIDLDGFKPINDRHGHAAGDAVLVEIGRRLSGLVRRGEIVARMGGDEFVVVLDSGTADEAPLRAARRLVDSIAEGILLPQGEVKVSGSVGIAFFPADGTAADELIRKADVALYRAKNEARGDIRSYHESMDYAARERETLEADLREAIATGRIEPYFQPLVDLASARLTGFEVLARWSHPTRGPVPPATFVPIAEDSGQIDALTVGVMRNALAAARHWDPSITLAVNIAPQQLTNDKLVDRLLDVLRETGFPPQRFEIEIKEDALMGDLDLARRIVLALKAHGVRVALDNFGRGYNSLSRLRKLPFDKIKIDRSFIHSMQGRPESATIVNSIIELGRSLNLPTTAEGIESEAEAEMLTKLGCAAGQGFLYSKAVPASEVPGLLAGIHAPVGPAPSEHLAATPVDSVSPTLEPAR